MKNDNVFFQRLIFDLVWPSYYERFALRCSDKHLHEGSDRIMRPEALWAVAALENPTF